MRTVHKYKIGRHKGIARYVELRRGFKIVRVAVQAVGLDEEMNIFLWAEVDTEAPLEPVCFCFFGTNDRVPDVYVHVASLEDRTFIWHLYYVPPPEP